MIRDHMRIWLLRPGFTIQQFGKLPGWLDETDERSAAEQLGARWRPIEQAFRLEGSALYGDGHAYEVLGAIHLRNELVMLCENEMVVVVQSNAAGAATEDRSFEVSRIELRCEAQRWKLRSSQVSEPAIKEDAMSARFTVYDKVTWQVFGRGLTPEEVHQCAINNVVVRDRETEEEWCREGVDSDMTLFRVRPLACISDDYFEAAMDKAKGLLKYPAWPMPSRMSASRWRSCARRSARRS